MLPSMIDAFRQTAFNRAFELAVLELIRQGKVTCPIYLSLGSEHVAPSVLAGLGGERWPLFPQHRCHSWVLTWGMKPQEVLYELLGGSRGSASLGDADVVHGHDGLLGSQVPISVGYALGSGRKTVCVLGDGAGEEDYVLGALGHAATHDAPVLFILEDNELSVETKKPCRRAWSVGNVARSMGVFATRCEGHPKAIAASVEDYCRHLPALVEVPVIRGCAHNSARDQSVKDSYYFHRWKLELGPEGEKAWDDARAAVADIVASHASCDHHL